MHLIASNLEELRAKRRITDLSYGAAEKLAMPEAGIAPVALEVISRGRP